MIKKQGYAIFDLDYTLIPHDTILLFANFILKKFRWRMFYLFFVVPVIPFALLKWISSKTLKQIFLSFLWKIENEKLQELSKNFVETLVVPNLYPEILEEIKKHKNKKILILNTAAPDFYAKYIGEKLGFDFTIATPFAIKQKINLFPKILGENNKSYAKIKRLINLLDSDAREKLEAFFKNPNFKKLDYPLILKNSISYSDSLADLPLLRLTEKAKLVNPENKKLIKEAKTKNWQILTPKKPFTNQFQKYKIALLQCLGFYN
ncbi:MAG: HAD family hydrolase [Leptonema sp. (in: bacteria)]